VTHTAHEESTALWRAAIEEGKAVMQAAAAREVWAAGQNPMHIMGGTVMGSTARDSVVNSFGQVHGIANLVLTGPGVFPTSGGVNPTFTALALAFRAATRWIE
jgi:choline dehydrogenase-like flavoprotein